MKQFPEVGTGFQSLYDAMAWWQGWNNQIRILATSRHQPRTQQGDRLTHLGIISISDTFSISEVLNNLQPRQLTNQKYWISWYVVELLIFFWRKNSTISFWTHTHSTIRGFGPAVWPSRASNCEGVFRLSHSTLHRHSTQSEPSATEKSSTKSLCWASVFVWRGSLVTSCRKLANPILEVYSMFQVKVGWIPLGERSPGTLFLCNLRIKCTPEIQSWIP